MEDYCMDCAKKKNEAKNLDAEIKKPVEKFA